MYNTFLTHDVLSEFERMNRLFARDAFDANQASSDQPAINVAENDDHVEVYAYVPGVDPASIDVSLHEQTLTLRGSRQAHDMADNEQRYLQERFNGDFERSVKLPNDIDSNEVEALYEHGVLRVTLKRQAKPVARKITVNAH